MHLFLALFHANIELLTKSVSVHHDVEFNHVLFIVMFIGTYLNIVHQSNNGIPRIFSLWS